MYTMTTRVYMYTLPKFVKSNKISPSKFFVLITRFIISLKSVKQV